MIVKGLGVKFKLEIGTEINILLLKKFYEFPGKNMLPKIGVLLVWKNLNSLLRNHSFRMPVCEEKKNKIVASCNKRFISANIEIQPIDIMNTVKPLTIKHQLIVVYFDINKISPIFEILGELEASHSIHIDLAVIPVIHLYRKDPFVILDRVKDTILHGKSGNNNKSHRTRRLG